jgi:CRP-like cAMP-binding protein
MLDSSFSSGEIGLEMFFIERGLVQAILSQHSSTGVVTHLKLRQMRQGDYFGEVPMFSTQRNTVGALRTASVVGITYCNLYSLSISDFKEIVKPYPYLEAFLRETAHQRMKYSDKTAISYAKRPSLFDKSHAGTGMAGLLTDKPRRENIR